MALLTTRNSEKLSLFQSSRTQKRVWPDYGMSRDQFCVSVVENEFNDKNNRPALDLTLVLEGINIDSEAPLLSCWSDTNLKYRFYFPRDVLRSLKIGIHQIRTNIAMICRSQNSCIRFFMFHTHIRIRTVIIIFEAFKCGKSIDITDLLDFNLKIAPGCIS